MLLMKKSEEIKREAQQEESDYKFMHLMNDAMREGRKERFEEEYLPQLQEILGDDIYFVEKTQSYCIKCKPKGERGHIIIDFYPKANKLLIRSKNQWIKPALKWIVKNIINNQSK